MNAMQLNETENLQFNSFMKLIRDVRGGINSNFCILISLRLIVNKFHFIIIIYSAMSVAHATPHNNRRKVDWLTGWPDIEIE